jgi:hypothetical protein
MIWTYNVCYVLQLFSKFSDEWAYEFQILLQKSKPNNVWDYWDQVKVKKKKKKKRSYPRNRAVDAYRAVRW